MSENQIVPAIELDGLSVTYGRFKAVDAVTLRVEPGTVYALLGRNGAGKSSLVRCLLGFQKPDGGEARLFGRSVWRERATLMNRVGVVPEEPDAPPEMTAREILSFCGSIYSRWDEKTALARLDAFSVPLGTQFGRLSKGQKRQVLLAAALATQPELLVLDDPTLGLDVVARKELFEELVADLADRGTSVFVTTHDLPGIEAIADRVGIIREGRLVLDEELETLKWRFRKIRYAAPASDSQAALSRLEALQVKRWGNGVEAVIANYDDITVQRFREESALHEVEVTAMSLEEIFIATAGNGAAGGE